MVFNVAQVSDPPTAQRDQQIAQIGQILRQVHIYSTETSARQKECRYGTNQQIHQQKTKQMSNNAALPKITSTLMLIVPQTLYTGV